MAGTTIAAAFLTPDPTGSEDGIIGSDANLMAKCAQIPILIEAGDAIPDDEEGGFDEACNALRSLVHDVASTPPRTTAGLVAKAHAMRAYIATCRPVWPSQVSEGGASEACDRFMLDVLELLDKAEAAA